MDEKPHRDLEMQIKKAVAKGQTNPREVFTTVQGHNKSTDTGTIRDAVLNLLSKREIELTANREFRLRQDRHSPHPPKG